MCVCTCVCERVKSTCTENHRIQPGFCLSASIGSSESVNTVPKEDSKLLNPEKDH